MNTFPLTYRDAMTRLTQLTEPGQPPSIRQQALTVIIRELSPARACHQDVLRALNPPSPHPTFPEAPLSAEQRTEFHLHPVPADPDLTLDDEDETEEEDDPW